MSKQMPYRVEKLVECEKCQKCVYCIICPGDIEYHTRYEEGDDANVICSDLNLAFAEGHEARNLTIDLPTNMLNDKLGVEAPKNDPGVD